MRKEHKIKEHITAQYERPIDHPENGDGGPKK
jgi:hypothetical protein